MAHLVCHRSLPAFNLAGQAQVWTKDAQTQVFQAIFKIEVKSQT